jgi:4-hydroxy-L-threonine phosphate dehydrogenase PdxA
MNSKAILIVSGEPNSIFLEIYFKILKTKKIASPLILITSEKLLKLHMKKLKFKKKIRFLKATNLEKYNLDNESINLIDVEYKYDKKFEKISKKSKIFIQKSFDVAFKILKQNKIKRFINGPISKKHFLNNKFLGITEYISNSFYKKKTCMLIYNKKLSVCPVTTHLPIKLVSKKISKKNISDMKKKLDLYQK